MERYLRELHATLSSCGYQAHVLLLRARTIAGLGDPLRDARRDRLTPELARRVICEDIALPEASCYATDVLMPIPNDRSAIELIASDYDVLLFAGTASLYVAHLDVVLGFARAAAAALNIIMFPLAEIAFYAGKAAAALVAAGIEKCSVFCKATVVASTFAAEELVRNVPLATKPAVVQYGVRRYGDQTVVDTGPSSVLVLTRQTAAACHKNVDSVLQAWPEIHAQCCDARLLMVGDPPLVSHQGPGVHWMGRVSDAKLWSLIRSSRLLALPSAIEAFGSHLQNVSQLEYRR